MVGLDPSLVSLLVVGREKSETFPIFLNKLVYPEFTDYIVEPTNSISWIELFRSVEAFKTSSKSLDSRLVFFEREVSRDYKSSVWMDVLLLK